jgi:ribokinase
VPRLAVVGHVEWVTFARVPRLPAEGEIIRAEEVWDDAGGSGAVSSVQLTRMAGACEFFTALGTDEPGADAAARLGELGVDLHAGERPVTRRAFTHTTPGERTITVLGERIYPKASDPLPWDDLAAADGVYFTAGDADAARAARQARIMVATPRAYDALSGVEVDVLILSGNDVDEMGWAEGLNAKHRVFTDGGRGGHWVGADDKGTWEAAKVPGPVVDAYGCGDSFAAGVTLALAMGRALEEAVRFGAQCGAACLTGKGPYGAELPRP